MAVICLGLNVLTFMQQFQLLDEYSRDSGFVVI